MEVVSWSEVGFLLAILQQKNTASASAGVSSHLSVELQQGRGACAVRMSLTPVSFLGKYLPMKQRQLEQSWPFS